jgi:hypothetical protein
MKRTTKYVALDVHQEATVASTREENGRVIMRTNADQLSDRLRCGTLRSVYHGAPIA